MLAEGLLEPEFYNQATQKQVTIIAGVTDVPSIEIVRGVRIDCQVSAPHMKKPTS